MPLPRDLVERKEVISRMIFLSYVFGQASRAEMKDVGTRRARGYVIFMKASIVFKVAYQDRIYAIILCYSDEIVKIACLHAMS